MAAGSEVDSTVHAFLAGETQAHELPWDLWLLWADGFHAGAARVTATKLAQAERDADWWYYVANNPAEVRAEHERRSRHFDVMQARKKAVAP